jgi:hypothetical protein
MIPAHIAATICLVKEVVSSYYDDYNWATPEGMEVAFVEYLGRGDDGELKHHESIERLHFRPLPPPIECDTGPLTHRMAIRAA